MSSRVRIPSNIDQEDRLLGGLTARQLVLIAVPAICVWVIYMTTRHLVPAIAFVPVVVIVSGVVSTVVVTKRDGLSMDRFALAAIHHRRSPKRYASLFSDEAAGIAPLRLPVLDVSSDGIVDLGDDGAAIICQASAVNLALHSETEQEALTGAFGRFCNSLQAEIEIVVRTEPVELNAAIARLQERAPALPSIGLEGLARNHAAFLQALSLRHDVLRRNVYVVFHDAAIVVDAASRLMARAREATNALQPAGIELRVLDQERAVEVIQRASTSGGSRLPLVEDEFVMGTR